MLKNPKKADLDKDGELSSYEKKRGMAIEQNMKAKKGKMMKYKSGNMAKVKKVKAGLEKASKTHGAQAKQLGKVIGASLGADIKKIKSKKMMGGGMTIGKGADYIKDLM